MNSAQSKATDRVNESGACPKGTTTNTEAPILQTTQDFAQLRQALKDQGHSLHQFKDHAGEPFYFVACGTFSRTFSTLEEVQAFSNRVGG